MSGVAHAAKSGRTALQPLLPAVGLPRSEAIAANPRESETETRRNRPAAREYDRYQWGTPASFLFFMTLIAVAMTVAALLDPFVDPWMRRADGNVTFSAPSSPRRDRGPSMRARRRGNYPLARWSLDLRDRFRLGGRAMTRNQRLRISTRATKRSAFVFAIGRLFLLSLRRLMIKPIAGSAV